MFSFKKNFARGKFKNLSGYKVMSLVFTQGGGNGFKQLHDAGLSLGLNNKVE